MTSVLRLVIVDDEPIFRVGLHKIVAASAACRVVGEARTVRDAVAVLEGIYPDVVLVGSVVDLTAMRQFRSHFPDQRIVRVVRRIEPASLASAKRLGASGVLARNTSAAELFNCLEAVAAGHEWFGGESTETVTDKSARAALVFPAAGLTQRELDVISEIAEGASNKDIAQHFAISENTVKHHLTRIFDKTGVSSRLELAVRAAASRP